MSTHDCDNPPIRVLLVEDDPVVLDAVSVALTANGYKVAAVPNGATNFGAVLSEFGPDIAILDVYLPVGPDGVALAEAVHQAGVPFVFLTAASSLDQRLIGFKAGADDYIVKPFSMSELLARVRALLRRAGRLSSLAWQVRDLVVDEADHTVVRSGHVINLSPTEFELLCTFIRAPGRVYSKAQLLSLVWGFDRYDPTLVEVYVSYLRHKLEAHGPRLIFTERGSGYVLRR
jgi:DNA-binding response OmpR family regulator